MTAGTTALIGVDWGTTNLRAYRLAVDGRVLDSQSTTDGLMNVHPGGFPDALMQAIGDWTGEGMVPVLLSGMVGARQGWREAPYVVAPAGLEDIVDGLIDVPDAPNGLDVRIVPGVIDAAGVPDVMRGEETQILGLDEEAVAGPICLPGTHSKWVAVDAGRIVRFATFMTGEVHGLMRRQSILARTMPDGVDTPHDPSAFARGVARSAEPGGLLHHLFGLRSLALDGALATEEGPSYLSGLLIGHELRAAPALIDRSGPVTLVGSAGLADRYAEALALLDRPVRRAPPDVAARGLARIAMTRGLP